MRDADAKRLVVDAELGRANLDSVRRLQRDWYTACLPAEDERMMGVAATSRPGPAAWGWSSPAEQTPAADPDRKTAMTDQLHAWDEAAPEYRPETMSDSMREALRALGYMDE